MRMTTRGRDRRDVVGAVDVPEAARAAGAGLLVLATGGVLAPAAAVIAPVTAGWSSTAVAVAAFAVAGARIGDARVPAVHGATAAIAVHLLFLPLSLWAGGGQDLMLVMLTALLALVVGAAAGALSARMCRRST